jgi:hypothetical protein
MGPIGIIMMPTFDIRRYSELPFSSTLSICLERGSKKSGPCAMAMRLPKDLFFRCDDYSHPDHLDFDYFALGLRFELTQAIAAFDTVKGS